MHKPTYIAHGPNGLVAQRERLGSPYVLASDYDVVATELKGCRDTLSSLTAVVEECRERILRLRSDLEESERLRDGESAAISEIWAELSDAGFVDDPDHKGVVEYVQQAIGKISALKSQLSRAIEQDYCTMCGEILKNGGVMDGNNEKRPALVIYHAKCYDGFTAAWIARKAMPDCELVPATYGDAPPNVIGREVYVIDFSYPRKVMQRMDAEVSGLLVLDHHKTAEADCSGLSFCRFDMGKSGCRLAWEHFFPLDPTPSWVLRIEDRDLWRFTFGDSTRHVHAYAASVPMTLDAWTHLDEMDFAAVVLDGAAISRYIGVYADKVCDDAREVRIFDSPVIAVNAPYQNISEICDKLLETHPECAIALGYYQRADGLWQYSLRSRRGFDVSAIAKQLGGGGHAQAAGFVQDKVLAGLQ